MTLKNNRAPLLCYFKLCASFCTHWWIQAGVTVRKHPIWFKLDDILSCVTLKFYGLLWKTIGHLFQTTSSFVHHFVAIGEIKLELQSGNAQFRSSSTIFRAIWPWNSTDDLEKQYGTSPKQHEAICIISSLYVNSNWGYSPETVNKGCDLCDLDLWPWPFAWTFPWSLVATPDNFMMIQWWEHSQKDVTDGQTDRKYHSWSCLVAAKNISADDLAKPVRVSLPFSLTLTNPSIDM